MKNLSKLTILLVSIILLSNNIQAKEGDWRKYDGSLLWKVTGKDLTKPSYIVGTHHLKNFEFAKTIDGLKEVMESTEQTYGEVVMSEKESVDKELQKYSLMPEGESYENILSAEDYALLDTSLKDFFGIGMEHFKLLHPALINISIVMTLNAQVSPNFKEGQEGIDDYIQRVAREKNKGVFGLETVDFQLKTLFMEEPVKVQVKNLLCAVSDMEYLKSSVVDLFTFYDQKKLVALYDTVFNNSNNPCPISEKAKIALVKRRNDNWIAQMPKIMSDKSTLFAVGALHLTGEEGVLFQLAKLGYKIEPAN